MPQVPQLTALGGAETLNLPRSTPDTFGASGFGELARAGERLDIVAAQQEEARRAAQAKYDEKERQAASNTYVSRTLIAQDALLAQTETQLLKDHAQEPWKISAAYQQAFEMNRDAATKDLTDPLLKLTVTDALQDDFRKKSEKMRLLQAMLVQQQAQVALANELGYRHSEFLGATSAVDRLAIALKVTETMARQVNVTSTKEETSKLLASTIHGLYVDTAARFVDQHPNEFLASGLPPDMGDVRNQLSGDELATLKARAVTAQTAQLKRDEAQNQAISEQVELKLRLATYDPDPAKRLTSTQVEDTVSQLVGRPGAMRATEAAKIVEETRALEQKRGPENIQAYNEMKALIDADPSQVSSVFILGDPSLSQARTRELLAYRHKKLAERAKADHFTNQPAYNDVDAQLKADYRFNVFGIPTNYATAAKRLHDLVDPAGTFKKTPWEAYQMVRKEVPSILSDARLRMLDPRMENVLTQYETDGMTLAEVKQWAKDLGVTGEELRKLKQAVEDIDRRKQATVPEIK